MFCWKYQIKNLRNFAKYEFVFKPKWLCPCVSYFIFHFFSKGIYIKLHLCFYLTNKLCLLIQLLFYFN